MSWRIAVPNIFTTINLLGGIVAVCLCIDGRPFEAGVAVMLGYLLGDVADGWVARLLGVSSAFGSEYDTIADHTSHVVAPAAIIYTVYRNAGLLAEPWNQVLAIALASSIVVAASIRHARNVVSPVKCEGVWAGLPRTVLGFLAIGYCNSALAPFAIGGWWWGVGLIPAISLATLVRLPFTSHHISRSHFWYVRALIVGFFVMTFGLLIVDPRFMFDMLFLWMTAYCLGGWMALTPAERTRFREAVAAAKHRGSVAS
jgi:CDP-diacylglycerol--serine O-phosphatidyltransferase